MFELSSVDGKYRPLLKCAWWIFFIALFLVWFCVYHHCFSSFACVFLFAGDADTKWLLPIQVRESLRHHGRSRNLISCYFKHTLYSIFFVFVAESYLWYSYVWLCTALSVPLQDIFDLILFLKAQWLLYACISCTCIPVLNLIQWHVCILNLCCILTLN